MMRKIIFLCLYMIMVSSCTAQKYQLGPAHKEVAKTVLILDTQNYTLQSINNFLYPEDRGLPSYNLVTSEFDAFVQEAFENSELFLNRKTITFYQVDTTTALHRNGNEQEIREKVLKDSIFDLKTSYGKKRARERLCALLYVLGEQQPLEEGVLRCSADTIGNILYIYSLGWFRLHNGHVIRPSVFCSYNRQDKKHYWFFWIFEQYHGITDTKNVCFIMD